MGAALVERHGGKVPQTMDELTHLPGVGRKTANVVLGNAFGKNVGVVVDTHVTRVANRLGLTKHAVDAVKIEQDLMQIVPQEEWTLFSHLLIHHGRADLPGAQAQVRPSARCCRTARRGRSSLRRKRSNEKRKAQNEKRQRVNACCRFSVLVFRFSFSRVGAV